MRVLVLGGYGLIGAAVVRALLARNVAVVGLGRSTTRAARAEPQVHWINADLARLTAADAWDGVLREARPDAIVNAAGALQDGARDKVGLVQSAAMQALYAAAAHHGVTRFVQISAPRAALDADTLFMRSKGEADAALAASSLDWVILCPGLVIAPEAYGGTALLRALAAIPFVQPMVLAAAPVQTVAIADVADAVVRALEARVPSRRTYDLVEAAPQSFRAAILAVRRWLGFPPVPEVAVPLGVVKALAAIGDQLGWLGWRPPLRSTAVREIEAGVTGDPAPWREATGATLPSLETTLRALPSTVQERWFSRLFLLKPVVIGTLFAFWVVTGLIALARLNASLALLAATGLPDDAVDLLLLASTGLDVALGLFILWRRTARLAALGMIATTLAYLLAATLLMPGLWADPLGPLVKAIPAAVLALVALALLEDR